MALNTLIGFHGSWEFRKKEMLLCNEMQITRGDKHWLGDGVYFYKDMYDAYSWIKNMYKDKFCEEPKSYDELSKWYGIIIGEIEVEKARIFDLDNKHNNLLIEEVTKKLKSRQAYSQRFKDDEINDGVTLNIIFNDFGYKDKYDVVIATFSPKGINYKGKSTRFEYRLENQICVKNKSVIKDIKEHNFKSMYNEFDLIYNKINKYKNSYNNKSKRNNEILKNVFKH